VRTLRKVIDDAPDAIRLAIPDEWRHRRIEVILCDLDAGEPASAEAATHPYRVFAVDRRVVAARDSLHER
jgi:hypothetical protein